MTVKVHRIYKIRCFNILGTFCLNYLHGRRWIIEKDKNRLIIASPTYETIRLKLQTINFSPLFPPKSQIESFLRRLAKMPDWAIFLFFVSKEQKAYFPSPFIGHIYFISLNNLRSQSCWIVPIVLALYHPSMSPLNGDFFPLLNKLLN